MLDSDVRDFVSEHLATLLRSTGHDSHELFGDRVVEDFAALPAHLAYAAGCIEGVSVALGMTTLEMIDELEPRDR